MKKLSLCIPTYNRARQLSELQANFLIQALDRYQEHIDVIVMDQSNDSVSTAIQQSLDSRIIYYRNDQRGYAANIHALLNQAHSTYIWLISDDDHILWSGFEAAMLEVLKNESDCIMLPISSLGMFDDPIAENYDFLDRTKQLTVKDLLLNDTGHLPFLLLSEAMVRFNKVAISSTYIKIPSNIFVQVPILFSMLSLESAVCVVNEPVINYVNDVAMPWPIINAIDDRFAVIDMILLRLGVCELLYFDTIPTKVSINEYIDLAKEYSTEQSGHFVNGILDSIHKELVGNGQIQKISHKAK